MFQKPSDLNDNLMLILRTQRDYFNSVLSISQKIVKQVEKLPVKVLAEMVNYRKEWIDKIQELENRRKEMPHTEVSDESRALMLEISQVASKLVKIDDKIYKNLEQRKMAVVRETAQIAQKTHQVKKAGEQVKSNINRINIVQE